MPGVGGTGGFDCPESTDLESNRLMVGIVGAIGEAVKDGLAAGESLAESLSPLLDDVEQIAANHGWDDGVCEAVTDLVTYWAAIARAALDPPDPNSPLRWARPSRN